MIHRRTVTQQARPNASHKNVVLPISLKAAKEKQYVYNEMGAMLILLLKIKMIAHNFRAIISINIYQL